LGQQCPPPRSSSGAWRFLVSFVIVILVVDFHQRIHLVLGTATLGLGKRRVAGVLVQAIARLLKEDVNIGGAAERAGLLETDNTLTVDLELVGELTRSVGSTAAKQTPVLLATAGAVGVK
jgi:hypothetical protein